MIDKHFTTVLVRRAQLWAGNWQGSTSTGFDRARTGSQSCRTVNKSEYELRYNPAMLSKKRSLEASVMFLCDDVLHDYGPLSCSGQPLWFRWTGCASDLLTCCGVLLKARSGKSTASREFQRKQSFFMSYTTVQRRSGRQSGYTNWQFQTEWVTYTSAFKRYLTAFRMSSIATCMLPESSAAERKPVLGEHLNQQEQTQKDQQFGHLWRNRLCSKCVKCWTLWLTELNPFTPKSDQFQISPTASPEILHHTVWRTWFFIAYSNERWLWLGLGLAITNSHYLTYTFLFRKVGRMYFLNLGVKELIDLSA